MNSSLLRLFVDVKQRGIYNASPLIQFKNESYSCRERSGYERATN